MTTIYQMNGFGSALKSVHKKVTGSVKKAAEVKTKLHVPGLMRKEGGAAPPDRRQARKARKAARRERKQLKLIGAPQPAALPAPSGSGYEPGYTPPPATSIPVSSGSGYDPNYGASAPSPVPASSGSGYDPDAVMEANPPELLTPDVSDPAMRDKLLLVKKTNPDYYAFIAQSLQHGSSTTLEGMGATPAPGTPEQESWAAQLFGRLGKEYADYQLRKAEQNQQSKEQAQARILAAQESNAYLTGDKGKTMMYLYGALALLGIAWLATRRK